MPKKQLKAWLPTPEQLAQNRVIKLFAPFLADPRLWHMNRGSMVRAVFVGVMCAFFPLPGQMPLALLGAILVRANVPMSIALTWITNPLTGIPVFWVAYWLGATLLGEPMIDLRTIGVLMTDLTLWLFGEGNNPFVANQIFSLKAFVLGIVICAILTSIVLSLALNVFWKYRIAKDWKLRKGYQSHIPSFGKQHKQRQKDKQTQANTANKPANPDDYSI